MSSHRPALPSLLFFLSLLFLLSLSPSSAHAQSTCLPTCTSDDARFLSLLGPNLAVHESARLAFGVALPADASAVEIGIFDGDSLGQWDSIGGEMHLLYRLFEDPRGDFSGTVEVARWTEADFLDNQWVTLTTPTSPGAQAPSGKLFYWLEVSPQAPGVEAWTNLKVRTPSTNQLTLAAEPFSFTGALFANDDLGVIYPSYPNLTPTRYDGVWVLHFRLPASQSAVAVWDGDLDYGSWDCVYLDTDDPDTPAPPWRPAWSSPGIVSEGVAVGDVRPCGQTTGAPREDTETAAFARPPAVRYSLRDPRGNVFHNLNPSGNSEWERFSLSTVPGDAADYTVSALPAGVYRLRLAGVDLRNTRAIKLDQPLLGVCPPVGSSLPAPCGPVFWPYRISGRVWSDGNRDGLPTGGELGIPEVEVQLRDARGEELASTLTAGDGSFQFEVGPGGYQLVVSPSGFTGGPLAGTVSTTGGDARAVTVTTANPATVAFGYAKPPSP